jgi:hypothetical protein
MLLSMFISFLLARKFRGKTYVLLMAYILLLMTIFSMGFPNIGRVQWRARVHGMQTTLVITFWKVYLPAIPLSFPFYADISEVSYGTIAIFPQPPYIPRYDVKLFFLGLQIENLYFIHLTTSHIIFSVSFFLLFNLVGAIFGYWISKATFIDKLLKKRQNVFP